MNEHQTQTETQTHLLVRDLEEQVRIAYLAGLVGKRVRYATLKATLPLLKAFGPYATIPWIYGVVERLGLDSSGAPEVVVKYEQHSAFLGMTFVRDLPRFDALYDMEACPPPEPDAPDPRDFGCEDLFEENEIGCPHCGHKLRVTLQATVRLADDDDDASEGDSQP